MNLYRLLFLPFIASLTAFPFPAQAQPAENPPTTVTFRFVPGDDMFYIPWNGNGAELDRLHIFVDEHRAGILSGEIPVYVDGYCVSKSTRKENLNTAFIRANRVKSELIVHKGLREGHFITKNYATPWEGHRDMVIVTLRIPVVEVVQEVILPHVEPAPEPEPVLQVTEPEPQPVTKPVSSINPVDPWLDRYCVALRTNLLYDAFLTPTLGVEWRANRYLGVKFDGSLAWWGDEHGKVQKMWILNPEVRWYLGASRRFYLGLSGNYAEYNVYKGMLGGLFSDDKGYQGELYGGGLTVGYQLRLARSWSLDFNLGLGFTRSEYDSFTVIDRVRVYSERDRSKNFWGPTQAGVNLVWRIGK